MDLLVWSLLIVLENLEKENDELRDLNSQLKAFI